MVARLNRRTRHQASHQIDTFKGQRLEETITHFRSLLLTNYAVYLYSNDFILATC
nr:MAG TPA_asm: hypothetical protein [Caudoviricetes sp.]